MKNTTCPPDTNMCRWGIIGGGDVCEKKGGPPLYQVSGCDLIALTRRNREAGEDFARRHGPCRYVESVDALLGDPTITCIYVASPPALHQEHTLAAAQAGKAVLCEKPMAANSAECAEMVRFCLKHQVPLAVAYYRRCMPTILRAKELLISGAIGPLHSMWLNTQFPISHRLDLVHYFAGTLSSVQLIESSGPDPDLVAETATGATVRTSLGYGESGKPEQLRLEGETGTIFISDLKGGRLVLEQGPRSSEEVFAPLPATHQGLVENFRDHLRDGTPLACDGETGLYSTVILDVISQLSPGDSAFDIDYDTPPPLDPERAARYRLLA